MARGSAKRKGTATVRSLGDARRERLLDGLEEIFLEEGFRRVTIGELAARLRCSRRTLYELAETKEEIFLRIVDRFLSRIRREGNEAAAAPADLPETIEAYLAPGIRGTRRATRAFTADITNDPEARRMLEKHQRERMRGLRAMIREGVDRGVFRGFDPYLVAEVFSFAWRRVVEPDFLSESKLSLAEAYRELSQLLRHGLLHPEGAEAPRKRRARSR